MKIMKTRINPAAWLCVLLLVVSCGSEESVGQYPLHNNIPVAPANIRVIENFGGGSTLRYDLPTDPDLLYVRGTYTLDDGTPMEVKASVYTNTMQIVGFAKNEERVVWLSCVDRSRNESEKVAITIHPLESPIFEIFNTLKVYNDFGGVLVRWENPTEADIVVMVSTPYVDGSEMTRPVQNFYSAAKTGVGYIRGFPVEEIVFNVQIRDRWGNLTTVSTGKYLPKFEEEANKVYFKKWNGDPAIPYKQYSSSYPIERLWDNINMAAFGAANNFFHTPDKEPFPIPFTFDLGKVYTVSRFKIWQRGGGSATSSTDSWVYRHGNLKKFTVYGSPDEFARIMPNTANPVEHEWIELGTFESFKPSGLPLGTYSAEDRELGAVTGEDFMFPADQATPVRYIRFAIHETWGGTPMIHASEISAFGQLAQ